MKTWLFTCVVWVFSVLMLPAVTMAIDEQPAPTTSMSIKLLWVPPTKSLPMPEKDAEITIIVATIGEVEISITGPIVRVVDDQEDCYPDYWVTEWGSVSLQPKADNGEQYAKLKPDAGGTFFKSLVGLPVDQKGTAPSSLRNCTEIKGLREGSVAEITWEIPTPLPTPTPTDEVIDWEPPAPLNDGIVIIVRGNGGYLNANGLPAFPGQQVTVETPFDSNVLGGFKATTMVEEETRGRNPGDQPEDAGPGGYYKWGVWEPWEDPRANHLVELSVWVAPFWGEGVPGTNNLAFLTTKYGPQFRVRSDPKPGVIGLKSFGAYWVETEAGKGWKWTRL